MADRDKDAARADRQGGAASTGKQSGDPGRTPGAAEGDRQTVEESLREKERQGKNKTPTT